MSKRTDAERRRKQVAADMLELCGEAEPKPVGERPSDTFDKVDVIKKLMVWTAKGKTLRAFCRKPRTPCMRTVAIWNATDLLFREEFLAAKQIGCDALAQQCLDICDSGGDSNVRHRQLRIATRMRLLAKWDPTRYGDTLKLGGDGGHAIKLDDSGTMDQIMSLLAKAKQRQLRDPNNRVADLN